MSNNLQTFIDAINKYATDYYATALSTHSDEFKIAQLTNKLVRAVPGRKYIKIVNNDTVVAFIDANTGDIFKPATYTTPAKGIRGNINSPTNGMEALTFVPGMALVHVRYAK